MSDSRASQIASCVRRRPSLPSRASLNRRSSCDPLKKMRSIVRSDAISTDAAPRRCGSCAVCPSSQRVTGMWAQLSRLLQDVMTGRGTGNARRGVSASRVPASSIIRISSGIASLVIAPGGSGARSVFLVPAHTEGGAHAHRPVTQAVGLRRSRYGSPWP